MSRPRVGFLGVGWIGRSRMAAMVASGAIVAAAYCEPSDEMAAGVGEVAPEPERVASFEALLALGLDGIVIATPSALHAEQSIAALAAGAAVFCQKPLGRDAGEAAAVVDAARAADRLLGVDFSYRHAAGMQAIAVLLRQGALGRVQAIDLVFHNAYGPDKDWFYDRARSGGGCVMDLGVHLVDLALWSLGWPEVRDVRARLYAGGAPLTGEACEDLALADFVTADGTAVRLACSWRLHAGAPAEISASFYGTDGGARFANVGGSFYDFAAERFRGTEAETIATPPDDWGGRAAADWARRLGEGARFDSEAERLVDVARVLDRIYAR